MPDTQQPATDKSQALVELGATGLKQYGGYISEEFMPALSGTKAIKVYRQMSDNDPIVGAVLFAIEMLCRQVDWNVQPASEDPADQEAADFVRSCQQDMEQTWTEFLGEVLSMLTYGYSLHEVVYKIRGGQSEDPTRNSRFSDGRIGWRKLPIRAQDTVDHWLFSEAGDVTGVVQLPPPDYRWREIPLDRCLLFRAGAHKNNPEGRSVLRRAYRPWFFKAHMENIEGIGVERDLAGLPVISCPSEWLTASATADQNAAVAALKKLVTQIKRDEAEGVVLPSSRDENGNKLIELSLLSTGGRRQFDTSAIIGRYDRAIAMCALADFILLGHEKVGSFALASSKTNLFATAIGAWLDVIAEQLNRVAIPRLFELNPEFSLEALPTFRHGDIESPDLAELGNYISQLSSAGMELFPDEDLEGALRRFGGLPEKKPEAR